MSVTLGFANSHDASACLFVDEKLVAAISEERLSRIKCDGYAIPQRAIDSVLECAGLKRKDIDRIAMTHGNYPEHLVVRETLVKECERKLSRLIRSIKGDTRTRLSHTGNVLGALSRKNMSFDGHFRTRRFLSEQGFRSDANAIFYRHHDTHAAAAAYYSGFQNAAVVTMDGSGDGYEYHTASRWSNGKLRQDIYADTRGVSPGSFYAAITELLGFLPLRHEGKILGLAAHGDPEVLSEQMSLALRVASDGLHLDSDFASQPNGALRREEYLEKICRGQSRENVAAAAQMVFEKAIVAVIRNYMRQCGETNLALNGGVFANVKLNQKLAALPEVDSVFIFPGMSDTGNSVGAALLDLNLSRADFFSSPHPTLEDVYWGPSFSDAELASLLHKKNLPFEQLTEDELIERAATAIHAGRIVGWLQGRMEFGPRALGNRSMLAAPTDASINKSLNDRLGRTEFMPFAPSALVEHADQLFPDLAKCAHSAEFMTITSRVAPEWHSRIPAVVHVDGTARPQVVKYQKNKKYHRLISKYYELSGIPLLLNTSFNVHEEPIVCAPDDAIRAWQDKRIDDLAMGNCWLVGE